MLSEKELLICPCCLKIVTRKKLEKDVKIGGFSGACCCRYISEGVLVHYMAIQDVIEDFPHKKDYILHKAEIHLQKIVEAEI